MTFTSIEFLLFLLIIIIVYYLIPNNTWRKFFLVVSSCFVYGCWESYFLLILLLDIGVAFSSGLLFQHQVRRKPLVIVSIILLLVPLSVFKYMTIRSFALPLGISFYTFICIGYVLDVYWNRIKVEHSILDFSLFVCFFPQIASGPIARASQMLPQLKDKRLLSIENLSSGMRMLLWGFFMKLVISNRAGIYVDAVFQNYELHNGVSLLIGIFLYSIRIYCDFAGYSLIALGCGRMMGYRLMNNFDRPYFSPSIAIFWRRWHISLYSWFRDYVYIPLGGSHCARTRLFFNIAVVFILSGLWHGVAYTYLLWGIYHCILSCIERVTSSSRERLWASFGILESNRIRRMMNVIVTFILVSFGWLFFAMPDIHSVLGVIRRIVIWDVPFLPVTNLAYFLIGFVVLLGKEVLEELYSNRDDSRISMNPYCTIILLVVMILLFGAMGGGQFIYFKY